MTRSGVSAVSAPPQLVASLDHVHRSLAASANQPQSCRSSGQDPCGSPGAVDHRAIKIAVPCVVVAVVFGELGLSPSTANTAELDLRLHAPGPFESHCDAGLLLFYFCCWRSRNSSSRLEETTQQVKSISYITACPGNTFCFPP